MSGFMRVFVRLFVNLFRVGNDPIQSVLLRSEALDSAFVVLVAIPDDHVPSAAVLVLERQHDRIFVRVFHSGTIARGPTRFPARSSPTSIKRPTTGMAPSETASSPPTIERAQCTRQMIAL